jgi:hypothetical protein
MVFFIWDRTVATHPPREGDKWRRLQKGHANPPSFWVERPSPIALDDDLFLLIPDATPYLSLIFDALLDLGGFRGKSTYIQHPGTTEPFRIAPAEPVAYTNLVNVSSEGNI